MKGNKQNIAKCCSNTKKIEQVLRIEGQLWLERCLETFLLKSSSCRQKEIQMQEACFRVNQQKAQKNEDVG